jgi:hypothetical protein
MGQTRGIFTARMLNRWHFGIKADVRLFLFKSYGLLKVTSSRLKSRKTTEKVIKKVITLSM